MVRGKINEWCRPQASPGNQILPRTALESVRVRAGPGIDRLCMTPETSSRILVLLSMAFGVTVGARAISRPEWRLRPWTPLLLRLLRLDERVHVRRVSLAKGRRSLEDVALFARPPCSPCAAGPAPPAPQCSAPFPGHRRRRPGGPLPQSRLGQVEVAGDTRRRRSPGGGAERLRDRRIGRVDRDAGERALKVYLDSSALVKLVQKEAEYDALRRYLRHHQPDDSVTSLCACRGRPCCPVRRCPRGGEGSPPARPGPSRQPRPGAARHRGNSCAEDATAQP